jgi:predicted dehydrogenase
VSPAEPARCVLVGVRGYGQVHAARIARLAEQGLVRLVAAVDPAVPSDPSLGVDLHADLDGALAAVGPVDVVVVAAPIGDHFRLADTALRAGADVLLEKPPVASVEDFRRLLATERQTGRRVQVGFQSLGSQAPAMFAADEFGIGPVTRVGAVGAWSRTVGYWSRSPWAGHRSLQGRPVVDGVATNALAHAVVTALALVGARRMEDVASVETDLYRANAIDSDDTSVVRVRTTDGREVTCALSLCSPADHEPRLLVEGAHGRATLAYTADRVDVDADGGPRSQTVARTDLLEDLLASRRDGRPLLVPLASTGAFMRVLGAIAEADEPVRIDPRAVRWEGEGSERRAVVDDVEHWLERAASTGRTLSELGVPWASPGRDSVLVRPEVAGTVVAEYRDGRGTIPTSSPRPVLHPVRTLSGVVVSATHPADHDWHTGVGLALPDVSGTNLWGGGTYVPGRGYELLDDHGAVVGDPPELQPDGFRQRLAWVGRNGAVLLEEERTVAWGPVDERTWRFRFASVLHSSAGATLASPGSKGRPDGGYGGFFWRFPRCADVQLLTPEGRGAQGELDVHGQVAPWVAWSADFFAGPGASGPATVVVSGPDAAEARDPWFVRVASYPGLGSALAWERPVSLEPGAVLSRRFDVAVADGRLSQEQAAALAGELSAVPA